MMAVNSGPGRVWHTGSATTFLGHPLRLDFKYDEIPFSVELSFYDDGGGPGVESEVVDGRLTLSCRNFSNGRGSSRPVLIGEIDDQTLVFMHFRAFVFGNTVDRTVMYTIYLADKDAIGWQLST